MRFQSLTTIESSDILDTEVVERIKELREKNPEFKATMLNDKIVLALGVLHCCIRHISSNTMTKHSATSPNVSGAVDWSVWIESLPKEYSTLPICWPLSRLLAAKEILPSPLWESVLKTQCL